MAACEIGLDSSDEETATGGWGDLDLSLMPMPSSMCEFSSDVTVSHKADVSMNSPLLRDAPKPDSKDVLIESTSDCSSSSDSQDVSGRQVCSCDVVHRSSSQSSDCLAFSTTATIKFDDLPIDPSDGISAYGVVDAAFDKDTWTEQRSDADTTPEKKMPIQRPMYECDCDWRASVWWWLEFIICGPLRAIRQAPRCGLLLHF